MLLLKYSTASSRSIKTSSVSSFQTSLKLPTSSLQSNQTLCFLPTQSSAQRISLYPHFICPSHYSRALHNAFKRYMSFRVRSLCKVFHWILISCVPPTTHGLSTKHSNALCPSNSELCAKYSTAPSIQLISSPQSIQPLCVLPSQSSAQSIQQHHHYIRPSNYFLALRKAFKRCVSLQLSALSKVFHCILIVSSTHELSTKHSTTMCPSTS